MYSNKAKYAHSSVDIGDHRHTNVQNCIFLKYKCDKKIVLAPQSQKRSYGLVSACVYVAICTS